MGAALIIDLAVAGALTSAGTITIWWLVRPRQHKRGRLTRVLGVAMGAVLVVVGVAAVPRAFRAAEANDTSTSKTEPASQTVEADDACDHVTAVIERLTQKAKSEASNAGLKVYQTDTFYVALRVVVNDPQCFDPAVVARSQELIANHDQPDIEVEPDDCLMWTNPEDHYGCE